MLASPARQNRRWTEISAGRLGLLVDHEERWEIGTVTRLMRLDADGPWIVALAEVTERPSWLKRGTPASFAFVCGQMSSFGDPILRRGLVTEGSVVSRGVEPAERSRRCCT